MKTSIYFLSIISLLGLALSSCGSSSGSTRSSYRGGSVHHYHHGAHMGWGRNYYGGDVIIVDDVPDVDIGMPEAVPLPMDDW